jgi:hypothetical protein
MLLEYFYGSFHATAGLGTPGTTTGIDLSKPQDFAIVPHKQNMTYNVCTNHPIYDGPEIPLHL